MSGLFRGVAAICKALGRRISVRQRRLNAMTDEMTIPCEIEEQAVEPAAVREQVVIEIPLDMIVPSPFQPRRHFAEEALEELAASIRDHGLMQPVTVRPQPLPDVPPAGEARGDARAPIDGEEAEAAPLRYELIAGERRWRAAQLAGLATIRALLVRVDDRTAALLALEENTRRADLNPIETARQYRLLLDMGVTQDELGGRIARSQPAISNALRLLELPEAVQAAIATGRVSGSHGKTLARWKDRPDVAKDMTDYCVERGVSVSALEKGITAAAADFLVNRGSAYRLEQWIGNGRRMLWASLCEGCSDYTEVPGYYPICLNPSCAKAKRKACIAECEEREAAEVEEQRVELLPGEVLRADLQGHDWGWVMAADQCPADCPERRVLVNDRGGKEPLCLNKTRRDAERDARREIERTAKQRAMDAQLVPVLDAIREERNWPRYLAFLLATFCCERVDEGSVTSALYSAGLTGLVDPEQLCNPDNDLDSARLLAQFELFRLSIFAGELLARFFVDADPDEDDEALMAFLAGADAEAPGAMPCESCCNDSN
jgi:ParB/RepB/Spo0J family partition protein